jgi:putative toxin-antitoxin system antitoxin component (TIGR02293 family)
LRFFYTRILAGSQYHVGLEETMSSVKVRHQTSDMLELMWQHLNKLLGTGVHARSDKDLARITEQRLPVSLVDRLVKYGLAISEISALVAPARTLSHRRSEKQPLSLEESNKTLRVARIMAYAEAVWRDKAAALAWLHKPLKHLNSRRPLDMLKTDAGARLVEELLIQIDEGYFA